MNGFLSAVLLRGRLSRIPYAMIAVPILLLRQFQKEIWKYAPLVFEKAFNADLTTVSGYLIGLSLIMLVLVFVLVAVSFNRLHDIGQTGFWALPYLAPFLLGILIGYEHLKPESFSPLARNAIIWLWRGVYWYGLALALALLIIPGRRKPQFETAASAF